MNNDTELTTLIFADGACSGNPGPGGWACIIATPSGNICELGGPAPSTTNNRMELTAAIRALAWLPKSSPGAITLFTDSSYVIKGITQWIHSWQKKGWKTAEGTDVTNQDLWQELLALTRGKSITWRHIPGHSGFPGNERVDAIAAAFSQGERPALFEGPIFSYKVDIHRLPEAGPPPKKMPPTYLSWVDRTLMRHTSWTECEQRVKGRSGAKYKKVSTEAEEKSALDQWGVPANRR